MFCAGCAHDNPVGAKFCNQCGRPLAPADGAGAAPERPDLPRYTPRHLIEKALTTRRALEGERKQVTVLFVDIKGSIELAERLDPEDWHSIMDGFFAVLGEGVHRFEGTINQYTGDGIMALFGAPHRARGPRAARLLRRAASARDAAPLRAGAASASAGSTSRCAWG